MLDDVYIKHIRTQIGDHIKGKSLAEANEVVAGEIYIKKRHLEEALQQKQRLDDEIAELRKFDVDAELKKQKG